MKDDGELTDEGVLAFARDQPNTTSGVVWRHLSCVALGICYGHDEVSVQTARTQVAAEIRARKVSP